MLLTRNRFLNVSACLLQITLSSYAVAGSMGEASMNHGKIYLGVFGGGGSLSTRGINQLGTAFTESVEGGALGVNAFGSSPNPSEWVFGGHIGYKWFSRPSNLFGNHWRFSPASELEGYYIGGATLKPYLYNNTPFLFEHIFKVSLPLETGVVLVNGVLNIDHALFVNYHPYIAFGAGLASVNISGAFSEQMDPPETGLNHFNSDSSASSVALAFQPKVGVSYAFSEHVNAFVEYRFLYLTATDYGFGNTARTTSFPEHPITTNWSVHLSSQYYNMGTAGIQFDI